MMTDWLIADGHDSHDINGKIFYKLSNNFSMQISFVAFAAKISTALPIIASESESKCKKK